MPPHPLPQTQTWGYVLKSHGIFFLHSEWCSNKSRFKYKTLGHRGTIANRGKEAIATEFADRLENPVASLFACLQQFLWCPKVLYISLQGAQKQIMYVCSVMSDSLGFQGLYATRLLCPWDFPGKDTRVGLPFPPPEDLPDPEIEPTSPAFFSKWIFSHCATWEAQKQIRSF